jgi:hypothetical protein
MTNRRTQIAPLSMANRVASHAPIMLPTPSTTPMLQFTYELSWKTTNDTSAETSTIATFTASARTML